MATFTKASGIAAAGKIGGDRRLLNRDYLWDLALAGRIYVAGVGLEGTALTCRTSLADTTPDIVLKSSATVIVVPLHFEALMSAEGGAAPDWYISYVNADIAITTAGTTVTAFSTMGPNGRSSQAILQTAPTTAAFTSAQNTMLRNAQNTLDNLISVEQVTKAAGTKQDNVNNDWSRILWTAPVPIAMKDGASWMFHGSTGTTGSDYEWTLYWAEIDPDDI